MTEDNELIEVMAIAAAEQHRLVWEVDTCCHEHWLEIARAALTAYRNHQVVL